MARLKTHAELIKGRQQEKLRVLVATGEKAVQEFLSEHLPGTSIRQVKLLERHAKELSKLADWFSVRGFYVSRRDRQDVTQVLSSITLLLGEYISVIESSGQLALRDAVPMRSVAALSEHHRLADLKQTVMKAAAAVFKASRNEDHMRQLGSFLGHAPWVREKEHLESVRSIFWNGGVAARPKRVIPALAGVFKTIAVSQPKAVAKQMRATLNSSSPRVTNAACGVLTSLYNSGHREMAASVARRVYKSKGSTYFNRFRCWIYAKNCVTNPAENTLEKIGPATGAESNTQGVAPHRIDPELIKSGRVVIFQPRAPKTHGLE
jgi:hypothetical protein